MEWPKRIWLVGFPGSGKSTYGAALAEALGWKHADTDDIIAAEEGKPIAEIFEEEGEGAFRSIELGLMPKLIAMEHTVISTGGGMPVFYDMAGQMLGTGLVIYLKPLETELVEQLRGTSATRPLLAEEGEEGLVQWVAQTLRNRAPVYARAHLAIHPLYVPAPILAAEILGGTIGAE